MGIARAGARIAAPRAPWTAGARTILAGTRRIARCCSVDDLFADFDVDCDGRIGREDALATGMLEREFLQADRNRDGYLDVNEFYAWLRGEPDRRD